MENINIPNQSYGQTMGFRINTANYTQPEVQNSVNQNIIQPSFNQSVMPTPQMNYIDPNFVGMVYPMGYIPRDYSFGQFVNTKEQNPENLNSFSATNLISMPEYVPQSVGLPMNGLIEASTQPNTNQIASPAKVEFSGLVTQIPVQAPQQKFALQPIPEEVDRSMLPKPSLIMDAVNEVNAHLNKNNQPVQSDSIGGRKINNWFTRLLDQKGQNYISSGKLTIDEVSRNAERILDDMIAGRIDYGKQGQYIIQPIIIDTLINYCSNKLAINRAIQFALGYVYNDYTIALDNKLSLGSDPERLTALSSIDDSLSRNITQAIAIVNQDIGIYDILYKKLTFVEATKNASSLFSLTNDLNNFKKQMKKRY